MVPACPNRKDDDHCDNLQRLLTTYSIGGILLKEGTQHSCKTFLKKLQSQISLLRVGDAEWGTSMRVTDAVKFPRNLTLGAIQDLSLIAKFGRQVGRECRQLGIDLNLAPVADTNTNPLNPVIGTRSFGDDPERVALLVSTVIQAMQDQDTFACAKHFPDHGSPSVDPHEDLPEIHGFCLEPFRAAIQVGVRAILTGHLLVNTEIVTFSYNWVHALLRNQLKFRGLIITDALNMKAISKYREPGQAALDALKAGHDLLLYGSHLPEEVDRIIELDVPQNIARIVKAVQEGEYHLSLLDAHVLRIINIKKELGQRLLVQPTSIATEEAKLLAQTLYDNAV
ncbi:MAG: glycoside hydrolase family 3 protein, partial [Rhabdochlamydiaceae bacterium]